MVSILNFRAVRVLVNARFLIPGKLEGIGLYSLEVLSRLTNQYPEQEFIFAFDRQYDPQFVFGSNVTPVVVFPPARHPLLFHWWFEWSLPRVYRKYKCSAFLSPDGFTSLSPFIKKNILVIHDLAYLHYPKHVGQLMRRYYQHYMPKFVDKATQLITISETTHRDISTHFPSAAAKATWCYNGVREIFHEISPEERDAVRRKWMDGRAYCIVLGAIHPRKNLVRVLRAFEKFRQSSTRQIDLLVVGRRAWMTAEIEDVLNKLKINDSVKFTGYLADEALAQVLAAAEALLYLSLWEGFGLPIVEAMASGVPVLTSNRSSMLEIAQDKALTVDPENVAAIAEALTRLMHDAELHKDLSAGGLEHAQSFRWENMVDLVAKSLFD